MILEEAVVYVRISLTMLGTQVAGCIGPHPEAVTEGELPEFDDYVTIDALDVPCDGVVIGFDGGSPQCTADPTLDSIGLLDDSGQRMDIETRLDTMDTEVSTLKDALALIEFEVSDPVGAVADLDSRVGVLETSPETCVLQYAPGNGANGGTAAQGVAKRELNVNTCASVSLDVLTDQFVMGPGTFEIEVGAAAAGTGLSRLRLVDLTYGTVPIYGLAGQAPTVTVPGGGSDDPNTILYLSGVVSPLAATTYRIDQYSEFAKTTIGHGRAVGDGPEVFLVATIRKR